MSSTASATDSRISVALCICNGAPFLPSFLDSLTEQSRRPHEVVVCDDASDDDSSALIKEFAVSAPFPVRLFRNLARVGVTPNFANAVAHCTGDIVALADQDDVWLADKLQLLAEPFRDPNCTASFSDAKVVDESLSPLGYTMWQRVSLSARELAAMQDGRALSVLLKHRVVTGATLAFRANLRTSALPIPARWSHDAWVALIASAAGRLVPIARPLVLYRQHAGNVVGGRKSSVFRQAAAALRLDRSAWYREEIDRWLELHERFVALAFPDRHVQLVSNKLDHLLTRANLPASRFLRIPFILREVVTGRYRRFARNWGSIAIDLLVR